MKIFDAIQWSPLHLLIPLLILQRVYELRIAKRNETFARNHGAVEFGRDHYPAIVTLHTLWFIGMVAEIIWLSRPISPFWPGILAIVLATQIVRYWSIHTLGSAWNTRILIIPDSKAVTKGPYRYLRHPNYVVVMVEILAFPVLFNAFLTAITASIINAVLLRIRIRAEEKAWLSIGKGYDTVGKIKQ